MPRSAGFISKRAAMLMLMLMPTATKAAVITGAFFGQNVTGAFSYDIDQPIDALSGPFTIYKAIRSFSFTEGTALYTIDPSTLFLMVDTATPNHGQFYIFNGIGLPNSLSLVAYQDPMAAKYYGIPTTFQSTYSEFYYVNDGTVISNGQVVTTVGSVPEPATWAMALVGFGVLGFALRRRGKLNTKIAYA